DDQPQRLRPRPNRRRTGRGRHRCPEHQVRVDSRSRLRQRHRRAQLRVDAGVPRGRVLPAGKLRRAAVRQGEAVPRAGPGGRGVPRRHPEVDDHGPRRVTRRGPRCRLRCFVRQPLEVPDHRPRLREHRCQRLSRRRGVHQGQGTAAGRRRHLRGGGPARCHRRQPARPRGRRRCLHGGHRDTADEGEGPGRRRALPRRSRLHAGRRRHHAV
ncbi:MAG: hypothetical protein AVDCRST_MAG29-841, partial [uncultured Nocardioidaceae bacterium]